MSSLRADAPAFVPLNVQAASLHENASTENPSRANTNNKKHRRRRGRKKTEGHHHENEEANPSKNDENHRSRREKSSRQRRRRQRERTRNETHKRQTRDNENHQEASSFVENALLFPPLEGTRGSTGTNNAADQQKEWSKVAWNAHEIQQEKERMSQAQQHGNGDGVRMTLLQQRMPREEITNEPPILVHESESTRDTDATTPEKQTLATSTKWDMVKLRNRWWQIMEEKKQQEMDEKRLVSDESSTSDEESSSSGCTMCSSFDSEDDCDDQSIDTDTRWHRDTCDLRKTEYLQQPYPLHQAVLDDNSLAISQLLKSNNELLQTFVEPSRLGLEDGKHLYKERRLSLLDLAIYLDRPHLIPKMLLNLGHDEFTKNKSETMSDTRKCTTTPLMLACELGRDGCIKVLQSHGRNSKNDNVYNVMAKDPGTGNTALHHTCVAGAPASTLYLLLGGNKTTKSRQTQQKLVLARNDKGQTPLHIACQCGHEHLVQALLHICMPSLMSKVLQIRDNMGQTPLLAAIGAQHADVVMSLLMWRGNHTHAVQPPMLSGSTKSQQPKSTRQQLPSCPLTFAVSRGSMDMVCLLLEFNDPTTASGGMYEYNVTTALHAAVQSNHDSKVEMVRVLVEAGANPCLCSGDDKTQHHNGSYHDSALSVAACRQDASDTRDVLVTMVDTFSRVRAATNRTRRQDPKLQRQLDSYFERIEQQENNQLNAALCDALVKSLFHGWTLSTEDNNSAALECFNSSAVLMNRGACMNRAGYSRLKRSIIATRVSLRMDDCSDDVVFLYMTWYRHYGKAKSEGSVKYSRYAVPELRCWSDALCSMSWMEEESDIECRWIKAEMEFRETNQVVNNKKFDVGYPDVILVAGEEQFHVHSELVSLKSTKLAAAIRFASMNATKHENDKPLLRVNTSLSPRMCKFLIQHIYHGAIVSGWAQDDRTCCQELLELAMVAEEFLCPSLVCECEMRLLASKPFQCSCWSCCYSVTQLQIVPSDDNKTLRSADCLHRVQGPSRLLRAETALDAVAVSQQLGTFRGENDVDVKFFPLEKVPPNFDSSYWNRALPFESVNEAAIQVILRDFPAVVKSESYTTQVDDMATAENEGVDSGNDTHWGPEALLLHMCLEELSMSPFLKRTQHEWRSKPISKKELNSTEQS